MYSQDSKDKALGMLRLTGDVEKTARMSGVPGRTLRRWAAAAAKPRQRSRGAKFEPYVSVNVFFTIFTNAFSPIAPTRIRRIRQRGCAAFGV